MTAEPFRRTILLVILLNLSYFGLESVVAARLGSVSLFADSVDFLEDASVNLLILIALGWSARQKAHVGMALAAIMLLPAIAFLWTLVAQLLFPAPPSALPLSLTGAGALVVNLACALLLARHRHSQGSLVRAAFLSARNDVAANIGIIAAGLVTALHPSIWPDMLVGVAIAWMNLDAAREVWDSARQDQQAADKARPRRAPACVPTDVIRLPYAVRTLAIRPAPPELRRPAHLTISPNHGAGRAGRRGQDMDHFLYRDGVLHAEDVPIPEIAAAVGTPFYVYSTATLERHYRLFTEALSPLPNLVCFAVKSNGNVAVLKTLGQLGAGMDVVSVGEYLRAKAAGVPGERIVFSGVGKTREEMRVALEGGIRQFNVESEPEMRTLSEVAVSIGKTAPITIRVNPDVDAKTHEKIATGKKENKFGIPIERAREVYAEAARLPGLEVVGIDVHIGSQLTELEPFEQAYRKVADLTETLRADGHTIRRLDLGGGLGIPYSRSNDAPPLPTDYGALIKRTVGHLGCEIEIEPGRLISGNAGLLVSSVIYLKHGEGRDFLILDAAMNDLVRPSMYGAHHDIIPVLEAAPGVEPAPYDVVGPVCETGDTFAKARDLPPLRDGDLVAFRSAGAYGAAMASEYNARPLVPEVLVHGQQFAVIRARPTYDEMINRDSIPEWL